MKKFSTMQELSDYMEYLERRIAAQENNGFSKNIFKRSFEIWGHWLLANVLISLVAGIIGAVTYACVMVGFLAFLGQIIQKK